jgi:hypothetical protein
MEIWNLNIQEYTNQELEDILSLSYPYNQNDIINNQKVLYYKLLSDNSVNIERKTEIKHFLNNVVGRLEKLISHRIQIPDKPREKFSDLKNTVIPLNDNLLIVNADEQKEAYMLPPTAGLNNGHSGGAPPGILNPIKYRTIKRAVNIDSKFRPNYYQTSSADQHLTLPYRFENVINMRLASIELPMSFYAISQGQGNNCFRVDWDLSGDFVTQKPTRPFQNSVIVKIPDGNYQTFIKPHTTGLAMIEPSINAALNASTIIPRGGSNIIDPNQYSIQDDVNFNLRYTVDTVSGRSIFALDVSGIQPEELSTLITNGRLAYQITFGITTMGDNINNEPLPFFLGWQLGYRVIKYYAGPGIVQDIDNIILPAAIASEGICYPKGPSYVFIAIDDYNNNVNNYYVSAYSDSINNRNILARINISSIVQSNGVYQTGEDDGFSTQINRSRQYFGPVNIEKLRITLYDEYGRNLILNNMDWSCALMFECIYS